MGESSEFKEHWAQNLPLVSEELIFVDDHGNIRIPDEIRRVTSIGKYVRIEARNGFACLIPVSPQKKRK